MAQANRLKNGQAIIFEGELCKVMNLTHLTPGNLRAMVQAKMRNIKTGIQFEHRFRSTEEVETAFLQTVQMEYLYVDGDTYHFMNSSNYEQIALSKEELGDAVNYMLPNSKVNVTMYEGSPIGVDIPKTVDLKVVEAEASLKRQTASASYKKCTVETGLVVQVPQFVEAGDVIRIDTETGNYLERAN